MCCAIYIDCCFLIADSIRTFKPLGKYSYKSSFMMRCIVYQPFYIYRFSRPRIIRTLSNHSAAENQLRFHKHFIIRYTHTICLHPYKPYTDNTYSPISIMFAKKMLL